jgi:N-succinyldiaminopimelate aminotransferase
MSQLALDTGSINLGQGFPDTDGPLEIIEAANAAMRAGHNQYPPPTGIPDLRRAIAEHQRRFYGLGVDPDTEVLVTAGATEAIAAAILALCNPGDEVAAFEPYYDSYPANIAMAGAVRRPITLRAPDFALDVDALRATIGPRTRLLILNTPHNPTGKVFTRDELTEIAQVCIEHEVIVVADEVYEHLTYGVPHIPMASIPGMADRTITVSSAGKTFSFTGWKVGWLCASAELVTAVRTVKQFLTYVNAAPFQHAIAQA